MHFRGMRKRKRFTIALQKGIPQISLAVVLLLVLPVFLSACGRREEKQEPAETSYVYVPAFTEILQPQNQNIYFPRIIGDSLYYGAIQLPIGEGEPIRRFVIEYSLSEDKILRRMLTGEGNGVIYDYFVSEDGWVYVTDAAINEESSGAQTYVFDGEGNLQTTIDLLSYNIRSTSWAPMSDRQRRMYLPNEASVLLIEADGTLKGEVDLEDCDYICDAGFNREHAFCVIYQSSEEGHPLVLAQIDFDGAEALTLDADFPVHSAQSFLVAGASGSDYDFVLNDGNALYGYRLDTQTAEKILSWMDSDLNGQNILSVCPDEGSGFRAVFYDSVNGSWDIAALEKREASTLPQKTELVLASLYVSMDMEEAVSSFNRSSQNCHITIRQYWNPDTQTQDAIASLNTDLVSAESSPDIIDLSFLNAEALASNGVFADITPFMEQSSVLHRENYPQNLVDGFTYDGIWVCVPGSVTVKTYIGKAAEVGERNGWTLEEMLDCAAENPGKELYYDWLTPSANTDLSGRKTIALSNFLTFGQAAFIDWESGTCRFDSEEFQKLLQFVQDTTPVEAPNLEAGYPNPNALLNSVEIRNVHDIQLFSNYYCDGEAAAFLGYPTADGSGGHVLVCHETYAIAARSSHPEEAWHFLETYLDPRRISFPATFRSDFPTDREALKLQMDTVEYVKDGNGQYVLDSEGKPWPRYSYDSPSSYNGWRYTYHPVTDEEISVLLRILDTARIRTAVDDVLLQIITEEALPFFQGQKTAAQAASAIQNRVQLYLDETIN